MIGARGGHQALEHGVFEIARIGSGARAVGPQVLGQAASPFAVVEDELFYVTGLIESAQKKMIQRGIVQDDHAGMGEGARVNVAVQMIVADVIERDIGVLGIDNNIAVFAEFREERGGIVGDTGGSGRQRRKEAQLH